MLIRMAAQTDIEAINCLLYQVAEVHHKGRPDLFRGGAKKYTDEQLRQIISDKQKPIIVAADDDDRVIGYAFCVFERHTGDSILTDIKTLYIDDLCVDEKLRGHGIGKRLYGAAVDFAKEHGCYNVTLNVWECNPAAMKFYQSCGLSPYKTGMEIII